MTDILGLGSLPGVAPIAQTDPFGSLSNFVFFQTINDFLRNEIDVFQWSLLQRITLAIGSVGLLLLTIWIMIQGYRIVTGQSREPMMGLVVGALRGGLIIGLATSMAAGSSQLFWSFTDGLSSVIVYTVTGSNESVFQKIDNNLATMQATMAVIDTLNPGNNDKMGDAKERAKWFTGIGVAGPGVIAGSMLLLNKIALALFVGFGPLFILSLLFPQTQSLFSKWLFYGIGTMFSLAVLSVMVDISMRMIAAVTAAFAVKYLATMATPGGGASAEGINSLAMQQGGIGLLLSTLIVMAPPMAASFFQGTLANFAAYSAFGRVGAEGGGGGGSGEQRPGAPGYVPPAPNSGGHTDQSGGASSFSANSGARATVPTSGQQQVVDSTKAQRYEQ
jgi:type IV secretion system protein VirB6